MIAPDRELGGDRGLARTLAHQPGLGSPAERQAQRVEQDRLPRPGLPGQHAQPRAKGQIEPIDQDNLAYGQAKQHSPDDIGAPEAKRGFAPSGLPAHSGRSGGWAELARCAGSGSAGRRGRLAMRASRIGGQRRESPSNRRHRGLGTGQGNSSGAPHDRSHFTTSSWETTRPASTSASASAIARASASASISSKIAVVFAAITIPRVSPVDRRTPRLPES